MLYLCLSSNVFAAQVTFSPRLTLSEEYTDNVFRTRDNREEDFISRISPGATLGITGKKSGLSISYDPYYSAYSNNKDLDRWSHSGGLDAYSQFTKNTRGYLNNNFVYTEDPELEESASGRSGREPYYRNTSVIGVTNRFGAKNTITLQYTHSEFREETDPSDDSTTYSPQLLLAYWFTPKWGFDTELRYTKGVFKITENFENAYGDIRLLYNYSRRTDWFVRYAHTYQDYEEDIEEDYQIYYPSLGFDYTYDETTFLSLQGGPLVRDYEDRSIDYGYTVFADGRKTWPFKRGNIAVSLRNGLDYDYVSSENLGLFYYSEVGGNAAYQFSKNLSGDVNGSYRYNAYVDQNPERYDNVYRAGAGLNYRIAYYCNIRLNYSYNGLQSNDTDQEYYENKVYLGVSFFPRNPYYVIR